MNSELKPELSHQDKPQPHSTADSSLDRFVTFDHPLPKKALFAILWDLFKDIEKGAPGWELRTDFEDVYEFLSHFAKPVSSAPVTCKFPVAQLRDLLPDQSVSWEAFFNCELSWIQRTVVGALLSTVLSASEPALNYISERILRLPPESEEALTRVGESEAQLAWHSLITLQHISHLDSQRGRESVKAQVGPGDIHERSDRATPERMSALDASSSGAKLAQLMQALGYNASSSREIVRRLFNHGGVTRANLTNAVVAEVLVMMVRTSFGWDRDPSQDALAMSIFKSEGVNLQRSTSWNVEIFVDCALEVNPDLDWFTVLRSLDRPDFHITDAQGLAIILNASKAVIKDAYQFPITAFFGKWENPPGQLSFIRQAVQSVPELFSLNQTITKRVVPMDVAATARQLLPSLVTQPFNSLDLIETLVTLSDGPLYTEVKTILDYGVQQAPELMLLGFAQMTIPWNTAMKELTPGLVMLFLTGHPNSTFVLPRLWQYNQNLSISGLLHMYTKDPSSLSRILDVAQEMRALSAILETRPFSFSIDLAALASRRDYLNLEKWLQDHLRDQGDVFVLACLDFLNEKINVQNQRGDVANTKRSIPLSVDVVATFLRVLHAHTPLTPANAAYLKDVSSACLQTYPRLANVPTFGEGAVGEGISFPDDVEEEANSYYERIYKGELSISQVMDLLQNFKQSQNQREVDIYKCMVHNLFDEYKFFARYPDKELAVTSVLFGAMIQNQIVSSRALGMALRYVLDALRQPVGARLFKFGIQALNQFQARLGEWPQYCSLLLQISHLYQAHPDIVEYIKTLQRGVDGNANPAEQLNAEASLALNSNVAIEQAELPKQEEAPVFTALRVDSVLDSPGRDQSEVPNEAIQDKILFIINNISVANIDSKAVEMKDILKEPHHRWFSHYFLVKRASIEPNFHSLYIDFLDMLESKNLHRRILHETYSNIKVLLNSEKTVTSSQERSLLKNLGTWLGLITLAKNKPIKHKNLAVKDLLLEGYDSGRLIVVIPFVCKVLEQGSKNAKSKVFKPPNPWVMAIMKLLAELYHYADLKLNLKFEIEVLSKNLKLQIKDIEPTNLLRNRPAKSAESANQFGAKGPSLTSSGIGASGSLQTGDVNVAGGSNALAQGFANDASALSAHPSAGGDESIGGIPNLAAFITFNPNLPIFNAQPSLKRIVYIAIDRAIREIISPVVERSVTIAGIATRELVIKDFALENDENRMRKAAHLMVSSLAGSLASVSSREPLRVSMMSHLRSLLVQNGFTEQTMPEQAVYIIVADNLDLACSVLEKAAAEKALPDIDEALQPSFINRRQHRTRNNGPFYDMSVFASSRYPSNLPDPLRLKAGGLSGQQLRVYEDFARINANASPVPEPLDKLPRGGAGAARDGRPDQARHPLGQNSDEESSQFSAQQFIEKFSQAINELETQVAQTPTATLASLPTPHAIQNLLRDISTVIMSPVNRDEMSLLYAQKIMQLVYNNETPLMREICMLLLEKLCEISKRLAKEIKEWLLYHDDERKFNVSATIAVVQAKLLSIPELDMQLSRLMETGRTTVIEFTVQLIEQFMASEAPMSVQNDFFNSFEVLNRLAAAPGKLPEGCAKRLNAVKNRLPLFSVKDLTTKDIETASLREHLAALFHDWVRTFYHPASNEKSHAFFIQQLQQQGILRAEAISPLFFRVCTEICMDAYNKAQAAPGLPAPFQAVDAFARLIVLLVRYHVDPAGVDNNHARLNLTAKILSIIVLVLVHSHEQQREHFNQRPFFRLFSTLLNDLSMFEWDLQPIYIQILSAVSNTFHTLQPSFLPGFTFSWLQLVSHRFFMPKLLLAENQKFWPFFQRLLVDLFKFLGPFLKQSEMSDTTRLLYRATLRILLVLLHDFPEFLCDYHFSFVDVIPHMCIQLRNLILSAFPRTMRLPDPFTPNLKVDLLPEINQPPHVLSDYTSGLLRNNLKQDVDAYLKSRGPSQFLNDLRGRLLLTGPASASSESTQYNVSTINALVLYIGVQAIAQSQNKGAQGGASPVSPSAPMDIFQQLAVDLDTEGRYLLFSAIANQLRYPNSHTHYFSCVLLYLFAEATQEVIQEQITRVLIERLVVNRPHPYGLLITFIELIRNPRYNFWDHTNFIRCAPEIERLFASVAKSINQSLMRSPQ